MWLDCDWVEHLKEPEVRHCSSRMGSNIDSIYLHYTGGGHYLRSTWKWWTMQESRSSAHFIVGRNGEVAQCVPLNKRAWHAGVARFEVDGKETKLPDRSAIGIEMANFGYVEKVDGSYFIERGRGFKEYKLYKYPQPIKATLVWPSGAEELTGYWEPYPDIQLEAVALLCSELVKRFNIPLDRIVGHEDVAYPIGRKSDPGPLWPWNSFYTSLCDRLGVENSITHQRNRLTL